MTRRRSRGRAGPPARGRRAAVTQQRRLPTVVEDRGQTTERAPRASTTRDRLQSGNPGESATGNGALHSPAPRARRALERTSSARRSPLPRYHHTANRSPPGSSTIDESGRAVPGAAGRTATRSGAARRGAQGRGTPRLARLERHGGSCPKHSLDGRAGHTIPRRRGESWDINNSQGSHQRHCGAGESRGNTCAPHDRDQVPMLLVSMCVLDEGFRWRRDAGECRRAARADL